MTRQTIAFIKQCVKTTFSIYILLTSTNACAQGWETIAKGIEYRDLGLNILTPWSHIHAFRIDLKNNQLDLSLASDLNKKHASVDELTTLLHGLIGTNGGFFDAEHHPLGLRIGHHHQYSSIKPISWWGVFYVAHQTANIAKYSQINPNDLEFAVQSGPRLIINGQIPSLKPGIAERTALGITKDGKVILLVTDHMPLTTRALATLMKSFPLSCYQALNLDGGSSSQLFAQTGMFQRNVPGYAQVTDAIVVKSS